MFNIGLLYIGYFNLYLPCIYHFYACLIIEWYELILRKLLIRNCKNYLRSALIERVQSITYADA